VVVPAELRRSLGIRDGDLLAISAEDDRLVLRRVAPACAICGRDDELIDLHEKHLCTDCVRKIKLEPTCAICGHLDDLVEMRESHVCQNCVREISLV
jgi:transcriptional pleiotropic regulator of transition state genes